MLPPRTLIPPSPTPGSPGMGLRDSPPPTAEVSTILAFGTLMRGLAWRGGGESPPLALLPLKHPTPQRQPEHVPLNIAPTTPPFPPAASRVQLTHPPSLISDNFQHNCVRGHRSTFTASELALHLSASWPSPRRSLPPEVPSPGSHYFGIVQGQLCGTSPLFPRLTSP